MLTLNDDYTYSHTRKTRRQCLYARVARKTYLSHVWHISCVLQENINVKISAWNCQCENINVKISVWKYQCANINVQISVWNWWKR